MHYPQDGDKEELSESEFDEFELLSDVAGDDDDRKPAAVEPDTEEKGERMTTKSTDVQTKKVTPSIKPSQKEKERKYPIGARFVKVSSKGSSTVALIRLPVLVVACLSNFSLLRRECRESRVWGCLRGKSSDLMARMGTRFSTRGLSTKANWTG